jgi:arabinofuranosyltransferase
VRPSYSASPGAPIERIVRVSLSVSIVAVAALCAWGAWQRRWISDDGLIVLRTVRNLLAGNGPVFNVGERVEANTSVAWTYLLYVGGWVGGPVRLEYVALALSLVFGVLGVVFVMLGAARLYSPYLVGRRALLLPAGVLVYIAIPPARDFTTSGLETSLASAYLGLLWWMMVCWSQAPQAHRTPAPPYRTQALPYRTPALPHRTPAPPYRTQALPRRGGQPALLRRGSPPARAAAANPTNVVGPRFTAGLAFVAGLSVMVRPELALVGGGALLMMLAASRGWRRRLLIVVAGGLVPVGFEIFRMGYYGLLVPSPALAKDATGSKWPQGLVYLANFNQPYALWLPAILLVVLGAALLLTRRRPWWIRPGAPPSRQGGLTRLVQNPAAIVIFFVFSGLLQAAYWIRQGGDFMHGRVLLAPLFCLLAPVAVIPIVLPDGAKYSRGTEYQIAGMIGLLWLAVAGWSLWAANSPGMGADATTVTYSGIVDERRFYAQATGNAHPLTAADYLDYPRMRAALEAINNTPVGALLLPSGNYTQWDIVPAIPPPPPRPGGQPDPKAMQNGPHTVFFTNLGMVGMNVGLEVRVIDQIGLTNPLAAHTARLSNARIGHDKDLFPDWAVAEGPFLKRYPFVPTYLDEQWIADAQAALKCPATKAMLTAVQGPLGLHRFASNVVHAPEFTRYQIDRVPKYELVRCGLGEPEIGITPYTGLPATGP